MEDKDKNIETLESELNEELKIQYKLSDELEKKRKRILSLKNLIHLKNTGKFENVGKIFKYVTPTLTSVAKIVGVPNANMNVYDSPYIFNTHTCIYNNDGELLSFDVILNKCAIPYWLELYLNNTRSFMIEQCKCVSIITEEEYISIVNNMKDKV